MRKMRRDTIRRLYREAILTYWGCGDKEIDDYLIESVKKDIHLAGRAPGQWVPDDGVLEIYCESGIPNATDIHDTPHGTHWNSETWIKIDNWVNLYLEATGRPERVYHEPHNGAVIAVHWS